MANLKTKLIHKLGGLTKKECEGDAAMARIDGFLRGKRRALQETLDVMNEEYGNPEWGHVVYEFVKDYLEDISKA